MEEQVSTEIIDPFEVKAGDKVTVRVVSDDRAHKEFWGENHTFTAAGPIEYVGQGVHVFDDVEGYEYGMGGYDVYEFVRAVRA